MTSEQDENTSTPGTSCPIPVCPTPSSPTPSSSQTRSSPSKKRKLTSVVWNHFEKKTIDGRDYAICNNCKSKLKADSKNGTKHLHAHLERCVKSRNVDIRQQILAIQERKVDGKVQMGGFTFDQEVSRKELACAIILHEYPLSIVDHFGFKKFIRSLQPLFKIVSRNTIKGDILKIYDLEKEKTFKLFEKLKSRVSITTDMWTSNQKKGYMAITVHFIDESWTLQHRIIRFVYVPAPHNRFALSDVLMDCMIDWNLERKLSTITVDNCSTNDGMIDIMLEKLLNLNVQLLLDGKVVHMRCAAHILNLVVKDGLEVIAEAIEKIRDSVAFWSATPSRVEKFEAAARHLRLSYSKKLVLDCKTRWNSTYVMLSIAIIYKDVFPRVQERERHYTCLSSEEEWNLAKEICGKLKLFFNATEIFSGTKYPTANTFFIKVCEIRVALSKWSICESEVIRKMTSKMLVKFGKYWSVCHIMMAIGVVLDPRYKMKIVEYYFPLIYDFEASTEIERVLQSCYDLLKEYQSRSKTRVHQEMSDNIALSSSNVLDFEEQDPLSMFDLFVHSSSGEVQTKSEMDHYLEEPVLPRTSDLGILGWWKTNGVKYPTLQKISRDILAILVSTVASEFAFSTGGRVVSTHRSRLHPTTLEALMCSQSWLRDEIQGTCSTRNSECIRTIEDEDEDDDNSTIDIE